MKKLQAAQEVRDELLHKLNNGKPIGENEMGLTLFRFAEAFNSFVHSAEEWQSTANEKIDSLIEAERKRHIPRWFWSLAAFAITSIFGLIGWFWSNHVDKRFEIIERWRIEFTERSIETERRSVINQTWMENADKRFGRDDVRFERVEDRVNKLEKEKAR